jgi:hypothetical protein
MPPIALLVLLLAAGVQDPEPGTRAAAVRALREAKAQAVEPHRRGRIEAVLFKIEEDLVLERVLNPPRGVYARVGGLGEGAGFGGGPGYRYRTARWAFDASAAVSAKGYTIGEAALLLPGVERDGPFAEIYARRRDFPQEDFFGVGPDSRQDQRTNFALRDTIVRGTGGARAGRLTAGVGLAYLDPSIGRGSDDRMPSVEDVFARAAVPGLAAQPAFTIIEPFVSFGDPAQGIDHSANTHYRLAFSRYSDRDLDRFSFSRWDVTARQVLPFLHRTRSLALRARISSSTADTGHDVPFYLQPTLGGAYTLRGFRTFRFRDRSAALAQAEYRWRINEFASGALFYDTGAVGPRLGDLGRLEHDYGFGLRAGSRTGVAFRTDIAFGGEGPRVLVRFDGVF